MNKIILMGRLTADPDIRVAQGPNGSTLIGRFSLAVDRRYKRDGAPDADFFNCVTFGKLSEFVEKYLSKGIKVLLVGSVQNDNYKDKDGIQRYSVQINAESIEFCESKNSQGSAPAQAAPTTDSNGFMNIPDSICEELPFNSEVDQWGISGMVCHIPA